MFLGELLCLFVYFGKILYQKYGGSGKDTKNDAASGGGADLLPTEISSNKLKTNINPLLLAIPATFDIIASTMMNIALTMVAASVYQMLRGMKIIFTAGMSIIFLKKRLYRHQWTSIGAIFLGLILVGIAVLMNQSSSSIETKPLGVIIMIFATIFSSGLYVVEEKLLGSYSLDPLKVVGLEGLWGTIMWCGLLPLF
jgi:drug/metabolite transporter (DMT)-like permease